MGILNQGITQKLSIQIMRKLIEPQVVLERKGWGVFYKPAGMLSQSDPENNISLQSFAEKHYNKKVHLHSRIDRPVSGLCLVSTQSKATQWLQKLGANNKINKEYIAVVKKGDISWQNEYQHYHAHDKLKRKAIIFDEPNNDTKSIYCAINHVVDLDRYSVLSVSIRNGRFHQIRATLSHLGAPIKGDVKYMARRANPGRYIMLHAYGLAFEDPKGDEIKLTFAPDLEIPLWKLAWEAKMNKH